MRSVARTLPFLLAVSLLVAMPEHAGATLGDIWAKGVRYCATTHPNHGTIDGFGPALDLNRDGNDYRWPLYAPANGRVRVYAEDPSWGKSIIWSSQDGLARIHIAHLDSFGRIGSVRGGALIGRVGRTGYSYGPHVHAAERRDGHPAALVLSGRVVRAGHCYASRGPVTVTCQGRSATVLGTARNDVLVGTAGDDVIVGRGGDDR